MDESSGLPTKRRVREVIADMLRLNAHYVSIGRRPARFIVDDADYQAIVDELGASSFHGVPIIKMCDAHHE